METKQKLPKNVRQVGDREERFRVYLEDYVNTYLDKFSEYEGEVTFGVLVGNSYVVDGNAYLFIHGAMEVSYLWQDDEIVFSEQSLNYMQQRKRDYFPGGELCGIFVSGDENRIPTFEVLERMQRKYFPQVGSLIYLCDGEDSVFLYQMATGFSQLRGHYIYYERNDGMQSFMVEHNKGERVEKAVKEPLVEDFREKMSAQKQNSVQNGLRMTNFACAVLAVVVLILSVSMAYSSGKLKDLEDTVAKLTGSSLNEGAEAGATEGSTDRMEQVSVMYITEGDSKEHGNATENIVGQESAATHGSPDEASTQEAQNVNANLPAFHTVQRGDTLTSISLMYYQDSKHVTAICLLNNLENPNSIVPGQILLLPKD